MQRAALKYLHSNCSFVSIICFHVAFFMQRRLWRRKKNVPYSDLNCCKIKQERPLGSRTIMGKEKCICYQHLGYFCFPNLEALLFFFFLTNEFFLFPKNVELVFQTKHVFICLWKKNSGRKIILSNMVSVFFRKIYQFLRQNNLFVFWRTEYSCNKKKRKFQSSVTFGQKF